MTTMTIKEQTRQLWENCFHDSKAFIDLYFSRRYTDEVNQVIEADGKVVAALQMLPYTMTFCGTSIPLSYVSGACTHPSYRKKGYMRQLLTRTHAAMYAQGCWMSFLIPAEDWLKGYYAKSGYAVSFGCDIKKISPSFPRRTAADASSMQECLRKEDIQTGTCDHLYPVFNRFMRTRRCCIQHDLADWRTVVSDWALAGNDLWTFIRREEICGMAFVSFSGNELQIKEILTEQAEDVGYWASLLAGHYPGVSSSVCLPAKGEPTLYLGMARVLCVEQCLKQYAAAYPYEVHYIEVKGDCDLPQNNGHYILSGGKCVKEYLPAGPYQEYDIAGLTSWLLRRLQPFMSLMMD